LALAGFFIYSFTLYLFGKGFFKLSNVFDLNPIVDIFGIFVAILAGVIVALLSYRQLKKKIEFC